VGVKQSQYDIQVSHSPAHRDFSMKKVLLAIALIIIAVPAYLLGSGTIDTSSFAMILNVMTGKGIDAPEASEIDNRFALPEGFQLSLYASGVDNARFIEMTQSRDLIVTRPHKGDVIMIRANETDPKRGGEHSTLLKDLNRPSGIDVADGWLYIAESDAVGRIRFDVSNGSTEGDYERIVTGLTEDGNHPFKVIGISPDKKLYLAQGSTCNVCIESDARRSTMVRYQLDGSGEEQVASGLRNTMGFDWAPWNGALYATDNGRDMLGDDYPPCELNLIEDKQFYGWPYFNGANMPDPDFGKAPAALAAKPIAPAHEFRAHNAPLGMSFLESSTLPEAYQNTALVALHGSWNRSSPDGYRVVSLHWNGEEITRKDFLTGFEKDGDIIGRPVDISEGPDGAIYISDDYAGAIYRVVHSSL